MIDCPIAELRREKKARCIPSGEKRKRKAKSPNQSCKMRSPIERDRPHAGVAKGYAVNLDGNAAPKTIALAPGVRW